MPNSAVPLTFDGVSIRGALVPISLNCEAVLQWDVGRHRLPRRVARDIAIA